MALAIGFSNLNSDILQMRFGAGKSQTQIAAQKSAVRQSQMVKTNFTYDGIGIAKLIISRPLPSTNNAGLMKPLPIPALNFNQTDLLAKGVLADGIILTKAMPAMSEAEYEKAIAALAEKHVANGLFPMAAGDPNQEYQDLRISYTSVVSPDRAGLFASASRNLMIPSDGRVENLIFKGEGTFLLYSIDHTGSPRWTDHDDTTDEIKRSAQFGKIYRDAGFAAIERAKNGSSPNTAEPLPADFSLNTPARTIDIVA